MKASLDRALMTASGRRSGGIDQPRARVELAIIKEGPAAAVERGLQTISFADFKSRLRFCAGLRSLVGRRLRLYVHDLQLLRRPLPVHAALWALSLGRARVITRQRLGVAARAEALAQHTWSRHAARIIDRFAGVHN